MNILVSACLLGLDCKYSGKNNINEKVIKLKDRYTLIPVCPEQLGGLCTPRNPAEISGGSVVDQYGNDFTESFKKGAQETLKIAKMLDCHIAILKANSPSCGFGKIYDGTFKGVLTPGIGLTAKLLHDSGITIISDEDIN
ncbi:MAG: DUF523 domain-containing protein [Proteocatella sp.]